MGKKKYIETPEKMWEFFEAYKKHVKDNPRFMYEYHGKDGNQVKKPLEVPLTLEGFECYVADLGIIQDLGHYFANTENNYSEYCTICSRIRKYIRRDQIEGGMVGQYNASITQRINNLKESTENTNVTSVQLFNIDPLSD